MSRAAVCMHIKQPAVSGSLVRLRALLDDPLFVRAGRNGMRPTEKATRLVEALLPLMTALGDIIQDELGSEPQNGPS